MSTSEMDDAQVAGLASAICATAEAMGQEMSPGTAAIMAEDLCAYSIPVVKAALRACRIEVKGKLAMADILQRVQAADGRPGKDEAWAIALTTNNEFETVVLTDEIQLALAAAKPVLDAGDRIGARMAFMSAYERFVSEARRQALPATWNLSVGFDPNRRITAIEAAVQMQRIPQERAQLYLADLTNEPITEDGRAIAGLITGEACKPSAEVHDRLSVIRESIAQAAEKKQRQARLERVELYLRKRKLQAQVMALLEKRDA